MGLSVAIVCKNASRTIGRTLDSVVPMVRDLGGEIVALDSGSTDGTVERLEEVGARVLREEWRGYVETKQQVFERCEQDWVLALDADESLDAELAGSVAGVVRASEASACGYEMNRRVWYLGKPLRHVWQPEWRLRLFRRGHFRSGGKEPHDQIEALNPDRAEVRRLVGVLRHDSFLTIGEHLGKQLAFAHASAATLRAEGRRGSTARLVFSPVGAWTKQVMLKGGWRDGWRGFAAASSTAAGSLMKHAILLETTRARSDD